MFPDNKTKLSELKRRISLLKTNNFNLKSEYNLLFNDFVKQRDEHNNKKAELKKRIKELSKSYDGMNRVLEIIVEVL